MATLPIRINPQILLWARNTIGYTIEEVAARIAVNPEKIAAWEKGQSTPTYSQLENLAYKIYKRPLATFFRTSVPEESSIEHDFRNISSAEVKNLSPEIRLVIRKAKRLQNLITELDIEDNPKSYKKFKVSIKDNPVQTAMRFRDFLGLTIEAQKKCSPQKAFDFYKKFIEDIGIYVFQLHMPIAEARAFSLTDENPVIVLNTEDAKNGRIFSLFHEVCHILFNFGGVFKDRDTKKLTAEYKEIENFCDVFAASVLLPDNEFKIEVDYSNEVIREWSDDELNDLSRTFCVSKEVVLRKLVNIRLAKLDYYFKKKRQWDAELKNYKEIQKEKAKKKAKETGISSGIPQDLKTLSEKGSLYVSKVLEKYSKNEISYGQVSEFLEVKLDHLNKIIDRLHNQS